MKPFSRLGSWTNLLVAAVLLCNGAGLAGKSRRPPSTTAHTVVNPDYKREKLPDGRWKPETFAMGEGSLIDRSDTDESLTELSFLEMCEILAEALLLENYVPTPSVEETQLLIVVSWGKTMPHDGGINGMSIDGMSQVMNTVGQIRSDMEMRGASTASASESSQLSSLESEMTSMMMMQEMADRARREANDYNARLLGYAPALYEAYSFPTLGPQRNILDDLVAEIETPRYFVILQAYDFRKLWNDKEKELLWMTRFSVRAKGRRFNEELYNMASAASKYFGTGGGGLKRHLRAGRGEMGEMEVLGVEKE